MFNVLRLKTDSEMYNGCSVVNKISVVIVSLESYHRLEFRVVVVFDQQEVLLF